MARYLVWGRNMYESFLKKYDNTAVFPQWVFRSAVCFSVSSCCCFFLLLMRSQLKTYHANCWLQDPLGKRLPARSFHLLPGAECFEIFRNLPTVLREPSPQETGHVLGIGLPTIRSASWLFTQSCRIKSVSPQQCCRCLRRVGLLEVKYFFPSKMCLFCI